MAIHAVFTYDINDPDRYAKYNPGSLPIIGKTVAQHGGEFVFAGPANYIEGQPKMANVCVRFPNGAALDAWMKDPEYVAVMGHRVESTGNYTVFTIGE